MHFCLHFKLTNASRDPSSRNTEGYHWLILLSISFYTLVISVLFFYVELRWEWFLTIQDLFLFDSWSFDELRNIRQTWACIFFSWIKNTLSFEMRVKETKINRLPALKKTLGRMVRAMFPPLPFFFFFWNKKWIVLDWNFKKNPTNKSRDIGFLEEWEGFGSEDNVEISTKIHSVEVIWKPVDSWIYHHYQTSLDT